MAFCAKCGSAVNDGSPFCSACGAPQTGATAAAPPPPPPPPQQQAYVAPAAPAGGNVQQNEMAENVAGFLCYLVGWVTGLVFFLIDKRPFVRFHAKQSIVLFGGVAILWMVVWVLGLMFGFMLGSGGIFIAGLVWFASLVVYLGVFILWIVLMIKAYQGQRFRVPVVADIAEQIFGKS
jgi:uncharacterized membrane protein